MIDIKDSRGNIVLSVPINEGAKGKFSLGSEDYITLPFYSAEPVFLPIGSSVDFSGILDESLGGKFAKPYEIVEPTSPTYEDGCYKYDLRLDAYYMKWKNKVFKYIPEDGGQEASWSLVAALSVHVGIVLRNLSALGYTFNGSAFTFSIDSIEDKTIELTYSNVSIWDALVQMAQECECDIWVTDNVIHFGRCEFGDYVDVEIGKHSNSMTRSDSQAVFITRAYAFGSTKNLPANYRPNTGDTVKTGIVEKRLMLPSGTPYVDAYRYKADGNRVYVGEAGYDTATEMPQTEAVEGIIVFEKVFPHTDMTVGKADSYDSTVEDEDGTSHTEHFYYVTDTSGMKFDESYVLEGEELKVQFKSGLLNGLEFGITFRKAGTELTGVKLTEDVYEIVANENYGRKLPDDVLKPQAGDKFVLLGWDTTKITDSGLVAAAEQKLKEEAEKYVSKTVYNDGTFNTTLLSGWVEKDMQSRMFSLGQRVNLVNKSLSRDSRKSRVIGFEIKLDLPYDEPVFEMGESGKYSRLAALEQKVDAQGFYGNAAINGGAGSSIYVIRVNDNTAPSDHNVFSAMRSRREFLQKNVPDRAHCKITFEKGASFGKDENAGIDDQGNAELLTLIVRQLLRSPKFRNGLTGEGWKIWLEDGLAKMELDELTVRRVMHVFELIIDKIRSVGGQIVVSAANGKIKTIEDAGDAYRIYFEGDNYFMPHDLMRCATYKNGKEQHGYWVEISEAYPDYIVVSKWEFIDGEAPRTGDEVVLMGNTEDDKRQNLIPISATEDGQPRIDVLNGVKNKNFTGCLRARFGNLDGIEDDYFPADSQPHGDGLYADNAYLRGTFILRNGKDVITQFNVLEGLINSSVEAIRKDFTEEDGYLNNPNFYSGFLHWYAPSDTKLYLLGDKWIWANDSALSNKGNGSQIKFDDGRTVVDIKNSYITQHNAEMRSKPEIHTNADGDKEPAVVYLSFFYKVIKSGTLRVNFENGNSDGFIAYETLSARMDVGVTDGYKQFTTSGYWNGTGDFKLSFTGEIYISTIIFSTDKADAMAYRYRTLFEQTDRLVKITAAAFDKDGEALKETGLVIKPEGAGLYAQDSNGKVALIGVSIEEDDGNGGTKSVIKLTADNIQLEGLITANENFKVLADGSIEAKNGKFIGTIDATSGMIGGFNINWWGIGKETQQGGTGNGLSINQHYISIGTAETYSYLGNDGRGILIDNESWDETWAGRFVNTKAREKQYNYGIYIDVENGTKNYGLFSNAPLQAPAYISLTKKNITIDGTGTVTFDFENHNLFMVNNTASDDTLVTLPDENTIKNMFGYSKTIPLPSNFAAVFTIVMQKGSKSIMLANITNNDGNVNNERLAACDTMQLLCYVGTSGMIYQIINRKN